MIKKEEKKRIYSKVITSKKVEISEVLDELEIFCQELGLERKDQESIVVAIDEAMSNIVRHSYQNQETEKIEVSCELIEEEFLVNIKDYGNGFTLSKKLEEKKSNIKKGIPVTLGGYGLVIMDFLMDDLNCFHDEKANYLCMKKKVKMEH